MTPLFRVSVPDEQLQLLRNWGDWCQQAGILTRFTRVLKIIDFRLSFEPLDDWSEPYRDVVPLKLQMRFGSEDMVGVDYGVHENLHDVFVRRFRWIGKIKPPELS